MSDLVDENELGILFTCVYLCRVLVSDEQAVFDFDSAHYQLSQQAQTHDLNNYTAEARVKNDSEVN